MSLQHADRVLETSTTTGTGTLNLAGATAGFRTFVAGIGNGNSCFYTIEDGTDWETGIGTVTDAATDTLSRDYVIASSNSNALVNWGSGTRNVFVGLSAKAYVLRDTNLNDVSDFGTDTGSANAHEVTLAESPRGYSDGMTIAYRAANANTSTSVTINLYNRAGSLIGTKAIKIGGQDPAEGQIAVNTLIVGRYRSSNNTFEVTNLIQPAFAFAGVLTPAEIDADEDDYNPTGLASTTILRMSSDTSRNITGLQGGAKGRTIITRNVGSNPIVFKDEDAASTAANRFTIPGGDLTLNENHACIWDYDSTTSRWRLTAQTALPSVLVSGNALCVHKNLVNKTVTTSTLDVDADIVVLENSDGIAKRFSGLNETIDITASGANGLDTGSEANSTWYHVWAIGKDDGTLDALLSASSSAPTLPSGYTYKGYLGAIYNDSSGNLISIYQQNHEVQRQFLQVLTNGTQSNFTAIDLSTAVPPTAKKALIAAEAFVSSGTVSNGFVGFVSEGSTTTVTYGVAFIVYASFGTANRTDSDVAWVMMTTQQQIKYRCSGTNFTANAYAYGWSY
jgi:hypothetical protein